LKADLKKEKLSVKSNETALSTKIAKKELSKDALNDLIKAHLASIDVYNKKIETFNHNCANINEKRTVSSKSKKKEVTPTPKAKVQAKHIAPKTPPKVAQTATPTPPKAKKKTVVAKAPKPIKNLAPPAPKPTKKTVATAPKLESKKTSALVKTHSPTIKPDKVLASDKKIRSLHGYFLQIGAFKSPRLTKLTVKKLTAKGFNTQVIARQYINAVWVGPYESRNDVKNAKEALITDHGYDSYIIRLK
ncbi:MAG: SPOR domain-containing protein, partial [Mariprofundaceae bacterium]